MRRVQAFLGSPDFQDGVPVIAGAKEALAKLVSKYRLVVVTSRQTLVCSPPVPADVTWQQLLMRAHTLTHHTRARAHDTHIHTNTHTHTHTRIT